MEAMLSIIYWYSLCENIYILNMFSYNQIHSLISVTTMEQME